MTNKQKQVDAYFDMLDETVGKKEFTLLDLIKEMNLNLSTSQKIQLSLIISKFVMAKGIKYTKVFQSENNHVLKVNSYPLDSKHLIIAQVRRFLGTFATANRPRRKRIRRSAEI